MSDFDNNNRWDRERDLPQRRTSGNDGGNSSNTRSIRELDERQESRYPQRSIIPDNIGYGYPQDSQKSVSSQASKGSQRAISSQKSLNDDMSADYINPWDDKYSQGIRRQTDYSGRRNNAQDEPRAPRGSRNPRDSRGSYDAMGSQNARMSETRRRRRRRQKIQHTILIIVLVIAIIGLLGVAGYFLKQYMPKGISMGGSGKSSSNTYIRDIDITDVVAGNMALWLSDIDGQDIDMAWVKSRTGDVTVKTSLTFGKNSSYTESVDETSYYAMSSSIDSVLNSLLSEIVADRLVRSGYADSVSADEAMSIADQVLGMSMADYIKENGVRIVPSLTELNDEYTLGSGTCKTTKNVMVFDSSDGGHVSETVINKKNSLVLVESGRVYKLDDGSGAGSASGNADSESDGQSSPDVINIMSNGEEN